jgi:hypothetical protein
MKFLQAMQDMDHIQIDWQFLRPILLRAVTHKTQKEAYKIYEQLFEVIQLNRPNSELPYEQSKPILDKLKNEFFKEFIVMLLEKEGAIVADKVYNDFRRKMFKTPLDHEVKIHTFEKDIQAFKDHFDEVVLLQNN